LPFLHAAFAILPISPLHYCHQIPPFLTTSRRFQPGIPRAWLAAIILRHFASFRAFAKLSGTPPDYAFRPIYAFHASHFSTLRMPIFSRRHFDIASPTPLRRCLLASALPMRPRRACRF